MKCIKVRKTAPLYLGILIIGRWFQHINNIIINHNYKLQSDWISAALLALTMGLIMEQYLSCRSNWTVGVIMHITAVIGAKVLFRFSCLHYIYDVYKNTLEISWQCLAVFLKFCFSYYSFIGHKTCHPILSIITLTKQIWLLLRARTVLQIISHIIYLHTRLVATKPYKHF